MQSEEAENKANAKSANKLPVVYSCSGCSDAGELADRVARTLHQRGLAEMSCLAGIGGRVKHLVKKAAEAEEILVVDGCPISCAQHTLEQAGIIHFRHLRLQELGLRKGACPVTAENVAAGVQAAERLLRKVHDNAK